MSTETIVKSCSSRAGGEILMNISSKYRATPVAIQRFIPFLAAALFLLSAALPSSMALAAPSTGNRVEQLSAQTPDWLSDESASRLDVGIDVLAPSYLPGPFGGEPEIQASDGYYSLYWLQAGAPPTFLQVTGTYGGEIPAFSYYDRNVQLVQNASALGYPAYRDISPIYDVIYWKIGDVLYTVESHNLSDGDSMTVVDSLMYVTPPATAPGAEEPTLPTEEPAPAERNFSIGAPSSVNAGEIARIGVDGSGDVLLRASDGYFVATGEATIVVSGGVAVDWQSPYYESDQQIAFSVVDLDSGTELAATTVSLEGYLSQGELLAADLQCPAEASSDRQARLAITGNGTIVLSATDGAFPAEQQNLVFAPDAAGGARIAGTLASGETVALVWLAPVTPLTAYVTATDLSGNVLDECAISVTEVDGAGDLGGPAAGIDGESPGDGTGIVNVDPSIVKRVIANPIGFAGDASGGPEANGPDYGMPTEEAAASTDSANGETASTGRRPEAAELVPAVGENGLLAIEISNQGGRLANPQGATIVVPPGAFEDATTVMLQPVDDSTLPVQSGVSFVPGTAFAVTFSDSDGKAVQDLLAPATLSLAMRSGPTGQGARIYEIAGDRVRPLPLASEDNGSVSAEIDTIAQYVVGVPAPTVAGTTSSVNPFIIGGLGLIALLSAGLLISRGFQRRKTRFVPVRKPSTSRVRYR